MLREKINFGMSASLQRSILTCREIVGSVDGGRELVSSGDSKEMGANPNLRFTFASSADMAMFLKDHGRIRLLDCCFTDPLGRWHHCTFSTEFIDCKGLESGFGFDASSIPLFERIDNSDFVMKPDPATCWLDPFARYPTMHVSCSIFLPTGDPYEKCPRQILSRTSKLVAELGIGDEVFFGPEVEFFLFSSANFSVAPHNMHFSIDSEEAYWNYDNTSKSTNLGHRANIKEGYMTSRPVDKASDMRSEMLLILGQLGISSEKHHHEVATCQMEINVTASAVLQAADHLQIIKYVVKNVSALHGKTATFMPKPLSNDNGSGMHCNQSIWKKSKNLFYDPEGKFHNLSVIGLQYTAGILKHCPSILAFACPTTNSYRRLVPDFEAPVHMTYSAGNRSTAIRVPTFTNEKTKRIEFRSPDAACCPYIAFAAMVLAGLDGIANEIPLPHVGEGNLFDPKNPLSSVIPKSPISLDEALDALENDHQYLTQNGIFTESFIESFIAYKRKETNALRCCPHPREFMLYYAC